MQCPSAPTALGALQHPALSQLASAQQPLQRCLIAEVGGCKEGSGLVAILSSEQLLQRLAAAQLIQQLAPDSA
jgi:hypothetical protein